MSLSGTRPSGSLGPEAAICFDKPYDIEFLFFLASHDGTRQLSARSYTLPHFVISSNNYTIENMHWLLSVCILD